MRKLDELTGQSRSWCLNVIISCKDRGATWYCFEISIIAALYQPICSQFSLLYKSTNADQQMQINMVYFNQFVPNPLFFNPMKTSDVFRS